MEMESSEFVVALDIGSSVVRCLIAEMSDGAIRIVSRGEERSRGIRRGEVVDLQAARYAVRRAMASAENEAHLDIRTVFLSAGSRHVASLQGRACIGITREDRTVNERDVAEVLEIAQRVPLRDDQVSISTLTGAYAVDDVRQVREPRGMRAARLEAEVHVVTDARAIVENLDACLDPDRCRVEEHVFAAYAAGEAVLEDDERKLGVAVVDIGAGTTRLIVYRDSVPVFSAVVPVGGDQLTADVATGMEQTLGDAERLKEEHATLEAPRGDVQVQFVRPGTGATYSVDLARLFVIVDCRMREIIDIIRRELFRAGVQLPGLRVVLTGGTSRIPGLADLAETLLGCPVRVGRPRRDPAFASMGPEMATVAGLVRVGFQVRQRPAPPRPRRGRRMMAWLRQVF